VAVVKLYKTFLRDNALAQLNTKARNAKVSVHFRSAHKGTHIQGVSQLLKQSDWAQIQDFK